MQCNWKCKTGWDNGPYYNNAPSPFRLCRILPQRSRFLCMAAWLLHQDCPSKININALDRKMNWESRFCDMSWCSLLELHNHVSLGASKHSIIQMSKLNCSWSPGDFFVQECNLCGRAGLWSIWFPKESCRKPLEWIGFENRTLDCGKNAHDIRCFYAFYVADIEGISLTCAVVGVQFCIQSKTQRSQTLVQLIGTYYNKFQPVLIMLWIDSWTGIGILKFQLVTSLQRNTCIWASVL